MLTKNISKNLLLFGVAACTTWLGCKDKLDLPDQPIENYTSIYMPQAVNGSTVTATFKITDSLQALTYGANYGGYGYPSADIPVSFSVNKLLVDSFNLANKTSYPILPDGTYTLSATSSIIPQGKLSTIPLSISFKTKGTGAMDALKTYLLPVGVSVNKDQVRVNQALRTTFYVVKAQPDFNDYPDFDRSAWAIIDFSSQEANGEGPNNGKAIFVLDDNINSFWHTQWQGASPGPPHYLTIDMGNVKTLHGLSFVDRQNDGGGKPNEVNVQVSLDNITWANAGTFNLLNNKDLQKQFLPLGFKDARYFKMIINSSYNASYAHLAELKAF
jgi:hypothetical protein